MYCSHCGMKLPDWAHYCERCGTRVKRASRWISPAEETSLGEDPQQLTQGHEAGQRSTWEGSGSYGFTVNDAIRQELDNLADPMPLDGPSQSDWPVSQEDASSSEFTVNDAIKQELDSLANPAPLKDAESALENAQHEDTEAPNQPVFEQELGEDKEGSEALQEEPEEEATVTTDEDDSCDTDTEGLDDFTEPVIEEKQEEPEELAGSRDDAYSPTEDAPHIASGAFDSATFTEPVHAYPGSMSDVGEPDIWSTLKLERIDVGEDDTPAETYVPTYHRNVDDRKRIQEQLAHQSITERHWARRRRLPRAVATIIAALIVTLVFLLTYPVFNWAMQGSQPVQQETSTNSQFVSKRRAKKIVKSLEGWWTTNRTFDGRFWRIKGGTLETYAADGNMTKQRKIELDNIEAANEGLEGLEGKGYYLHSINFFLLDSDPNTLYALNDEGGLRSDANLIRTDEPTFVENKDDES